MSWNETTVLVTGGSGSFGRGITDLLLRTRQPRQVIIFSRDEQRQHAMRHFFGDAGGRLRYVIGDIRDRDRLAFEMRGVDIVMHVAAMKHVDDCEADPMEAVKTNVLGTENIVRSAQDHGVQKVFYLSTDKAVHPVNVYGASKMLGERIIIRANSENNGAGTRCSCMRSGNFLGSVGSVVPLFLEQRSTGVLTITDPHMTRFVITLRQAASFLLDCLEKMSGGEVFVPKLPSIRILDLARVIAPGCSIQLIGIRPGERRNEMFISEEESLRTLETDDRFVILDRPPRDTRDLWAGARPVPEGFRYASDTNHHWLKDDELNQLVTEFLQTRLFLQGHDSVQ